ncbi:RagB/SusD family nutrient uptake outer membrane protein [Halosquirtibacter laminarini]|uniref:RagB/SusD family nutrient uptake outer membrane protein n=1 Tax=Halosquirtibacter laminarini TaxID=3374600 RepID=A0AC61NB91_9BACT|nr:RagB/SusD family nutrient uptake outer membrane protein [Prolixibacteraceae bacterium]
MRRLIYIFLSLWMFQGCSNDFLDLLPKDTVSNSQYWSSTKDLKTYVNQFYTHFSDGYQFGSGMSETDIGTDDLIRMKMSIPRLNGELSVPTTGATWGEYRQIRALNFFFANYNKCKSDFDSYKQYVGEAYFFRAFFYFRLVQKYGDVPLIISVLNSDSGELYAARTSRVEIVQFILTDLNNAIKLLSSGDIEDKTRISKEAALLFKTRVGLYEGTWERYHKGTAFGVDNDESIFFRAAVDAGNELIASNVYSVYCKDNDPNLDYQSMFRSFNLSNNTEIILQKKYDIALGLWHRHIINNAQTCGDGGEFTSKGATLSLISDYLMKDGTPYSKSSLYRKEAAYADYFTGRDPRMLQTFVTPGEIIDRDEANPENNRFFVKPELLSANKYDYSVTGFRTNKGGVPDLKYRVLGSDDSPTIYFRYAEALLNFAEAKAELGELTQADLDKSINKLRDRVGIAHMKLTPETDSKWNFPDVSGLINEIRRERRVELCFEGFRFNDLMRWNATNLIKNQRPKGIKFFADQYPDLVVGHDVTLDANGYLDPLQKLIPEGYQFNSLRDYLLPISIEQLNLNERLEQNPGW